MSELDCQSRTSTKRSGIMLSSFTSGNIWKITREACATDENWKKRNFHLASRCYICHKDIDTMDHILWNCRFGQIPWKWLGGIFVFLNPSSFDSVVKLCKNSSPVIQELWFIAAFTLMVELWFMIDEPQQWRPWIQEF